MEKQSIIQISKSSLRFVLLEVIDGGFFNVIDEISQPVSIGEDIQKDGLMKSSSIKEIISILNMFRRVCDVNGVTKTITVANSFLKDAKNQKSFTEEVYNSCGFVVQILSVDEELKAIINGIVNSTDVPKGIMFYIDNDYSYILQYNRRNILNTAILPFGAVSLSEKYATEDNNEKKFFAQNEKMLDFIKSEVSKIDFLKELDPEIQVVCAGEIFRNIGKLSRKATNYSLDLENNYVFDMENFENIISVVQSLGLDKTKRIKGLGDTRADVLLCGVNLAKCLLDTVPVTTFSINSHGMKEGLIYNYLTPEINDKPLSEMLSFSLENIRKFSNKNKLNSDHVYELSLLLFKQLRVMHKLPRAYVKPLRIAASMFDCGTKIKYENYVKNSFYIVLNSDIAGVSQKDILLAAFACKLQDIDNLNVAEWLRYRDILNDEDLEAVRKLGVLVALANALDRSRTCAIPDISCDILGDSIIMKVLSNANYDLEVAEALKINGAFKKVFKKYLQII